MRLSVAVLLCLVGCEPKEPSWYVSCGDPVCGEYDGPFAGIPLCSEQGIEVGDSCDDVDDSCDPEDSCNALLICAQEDPTLDGCPISLRRHKREIAYLTPAQRAEASRELLDMRLATWRYRGELDDGAQHLGFLIDDVPGSAAVRPDGEHVDLYGFVSLAVATLQEQQAKIDLLERRMAELEATRASTR